MKKEQKYAPFSPWSIEIVLTNFTTSDFPVFK